MPRIESTKTYADYIDAEAKKKNITKERAERWKAEYRTNAHIYGRNVRTMY